VIEDDERKLLVRRIFSNGRRRYDPASKERFVVTRLEAGVSVSRLALEHGVNANLLRKWIKTVKETGTLRAPMRAAFIPVHARAVPVRLGSR
jgi:transposase